MRLLDVGHQQRKEHLVNEIGILTQRLLQVRRLQDLRQHLLRLLHPLLTAFLHTLLHRHGEFAHLFQRLLLVCGWLLLKSRCNFKQELIVEERGNTHHHRGAHIAPFRLLPQVNQQRNELGMRGIGPNFR